MPSDSLSDLVARVNGELTPSEEKLARLMLEDPTVVAFSTVADLARLADVSSPTVTRFARTIGFDGYSELQEHVQSSLASRLTRPSERIRASEKESSHTQRNELIGALDHILERLTDERVAEVSEPIARADTVYIVSGETSLGGARILESGLMILGKHTAFIHDHLSGGLLGSASDRDAAVVFDFHRYRRWAYSAASHLKSQGVWMVAVTDGALSPYAAIADTWLDLIVPGFGPFDSSIPSAAVAESIVGGVAAALGDEAVTSIDMTEAAWNATSTFLD